MKIEVGKCYRTRDGRKVGPMVKDLPGDLHPWSEEGDVSTHIWKDDGTSEWEGDPDLIAEWTEPETGTLAELDVKPGDVVELIEKNSLFYGNTYTIQDDGQVLDNENAPRYYGYAFGPYEDDCTTIFRIISRASDMPKTWGEMTPEEKMPLLLDWNDNSAKNVQQWNGSEWVRMQTGRFGRVNKYRLKPEPVRETVTLYGGAGYGLGYEFDRNLTEHCSHRLTFTTTDGKPATGTFTNGNGDVIIMEEV